MSDHLDEKGRCCGRKPLVYKRPTHSLFCSRCDREFDPSGKQVATWAWRKAANGFERIPAKCRVCGHECLPEDMPKHYDDKHPRGVGR